MQVFCDESGNSDINLYEPNQPVYILGALIFKQSCSKFYKKVDSLKAKHGLSEYEIHGKDLFQFKRYDFYLELLTLLKELKDYDTQIFLGIAEKRFLIAAKIFETFFDPELNLAAPPKLYWDNTLKVAMAEFIRDCTTEELIKLFASKAMNGSLEALCESAEILKKELFLHRKKISLNTVNDLLQYGLSDRYIQTIIRSVIKYILKRPQKFLDDLGKKKMNHTPNMACFTVILQKLNAVAKQDGVTKAEFYHDETKKFEDSFLEVFDTFQNAGEGEIDFGNGKTMVLPLKNLARPEFIRSSSKLEIQLIDAIIYLINRLCAKRLKGQEYTEFEKAAKEKLVDLIDTNLKNHLFVIGSRSNMSPVF